MGDEKRKQRYLFGHPVVRSPIFLSIISWACVAAVLIVMLIAWALRKLLGSAG